MTESREKSRIIVQSDWDEVLRENENSAWVTYKKPGCPSVHGDLLCHGVAASGNPYLTTSDGFSVDDIAKKNITVCYQDGETTCKCKYQAPFMSFSTQHRPGKSVIGLDVTSGGLGISSDTDGHLKLWTTNNGEVRRNLEGHFGDVYTCRFFPSGLVVLSGGADTQLKIWSAETGVCAASLLGHKAGITDTSVVERGRNIVSTSRDGTAKLWDCGSQTCLGTFSELGGIINACAIGTCPDAAPGTPDQPSSERETATEGKVLLLAGENGTLQGFGLQTRKKIFEVKCSDAVNCCTFVSDVLAVCGTQDSRLYLVDIRNTGIPLKEFKEARSAILSLCPYQQSLFVTTGDGSCFALDEQHETCVELTGPDCDPVYRVVTDGTFLYTSCRDGNIRKYRLAP